MSTQPDPIQTEAQEALTAGVTQAEEIVATDPSAIPAVSHDQKAIAAYLLWEEAGAIPDSPLTLNFWLLGEAALETETP